MMVLNNRRPCSFLLQLISLAVSISLSISRLHDSVLQQIDSQNPSEASTFPRPALTAHDTIYPSTRETLELSHLSSLVYYFSDLHAHDCTPFDDIKTWYSSKHDSFVTDGATYRCHLYEQDAQDTQVLILSRTTNTNKSTKTIPTAVDDKDVYGSMGDYVAVVYAGTNDFRTALTDIHCVTSQFGPQDVNGTYPLSPAHDVRVHAGFNNAVFGCNLMDRVTDTVRKVVDERKDAEMTMDGAEGNRKIKIFTTGHSLGAADSVLCAVALSPYVDHVSSVSFGCPKTGNYGWRQYVNSIPNIGVWRVVNLWDLVPRMPLMPGIGFRHVGHTLQFWHKDARLYYLHDGDVDLGFRGVPFGWEASSYILSPLAAYEHLINQYINYLRLKSLVDENQYFVNKFEKISNATYKSVMGDAPEMDDTEMRKIWKKYADQYIKFARDGHGTVGDNNVEVSYDDWIEKNNATLAIL